jgi:hypothetical protein
MKVIFHLNSLLLLLLLLLHLNQQAFHKRCLLELLLLY